MPAGIFRMEHIQVPGKRRPVYYRSAYRKLQLLQKNDLKYHNEQHLEFFLSYSKELFLFSG